MAAKLDELGVKYGMDVKYGAHDWGVWRDALTTFVKDYLWDYEQLPVASDYKPGVTVEENSNDG